MDKLASHERANEFSSEFLKLIRTKMLVVETLNGKGTKNGRASAMNIARYLNDIRRKLPEEPQA